MNLELTFSPVELSHEADFTIGAAEVHPAICEVEIGDRRISMEPRVMQVLVALAHHEDQVLSRDDLIQSCWRGRVVGDDAIVRCISAVRRLGVEAGFSVETIVRVGYRLYRNHRRGATPARIPVFDRRAIQGGLARVRTILARRALTAILLVFLFVAVIVTALIWRQRQAPVVSVVRPLIAVLPFDTRYQDVDAQFYADGVAASIVNIASRSGLPVVSQTFSFRYRGPDKAKAASELGVMYLLDGDIRREDGQLKISVHLDDARSGLTLMTRNFEAPVKDAGSLGERTATEIVRVVSGLPLSTRPEWKLLPRLMQIDEQSNQGDTTAALQSARKLAADEPRSAIAATMVAMLSADALMVSPPAERREILRQGRNAAEHAKALDPHFADPYIAAYQLTPSSLWADREAYLRQGVATDPTSASALSWLGDSLHAAGRLHDAEPLLRTALMRDSISPPKTQNLLQLLIAEGKIDEAEAVLERSMRLWPTERWVAAGRLVIAMSGGRSKDALAVLDDPTGKSLEPAGPAQPLHKLIRALETRTDADIAEAARACLAPAFKLGLYSRMCLIYLAELGRLDEAFALADARYPDLDGADRRAVERKWLAATDRISDPSALFEPQAAPLRRDPRFAKVAHRLGLMDYWRTNGPPDFCQTEQAPVCASLHH